MGVAAIADENRTFRFAPAIQKSSGAAWIRMA